MIPKVFVGSSSEMLSVAKEIQIALSESGRSGGQFVKGTPGSEVQ
jgi:hypothetical protein